MLYFIESNVARAPLLKPIDNFSGMGRRFQDTRCLFAISSIAAYETNFKMFKRHLETRTTNHYSTFNS